MSESHVLEHPRVQGLFRAFTHDGGVVAVGDAGDSVDSREHGAHVVLVQLDRVGVRVEIVTAQRCGCPVGV